MYVQAKKALKEDPKDDEEVERQEDGNIERGFTESSSSSEDELTEAGTANAEKMPYQSGVLTIDPIIPTCILCVCATVNYAVFADSCTTLVSTLSKYV